MKSIFKLFSKAIAVMLLIVLSVTQFVSALANDVGAVPEVFGEYSEEFDFSYTVSGSEMTITGYTGDEINLIIEPNYTIDGINYTVTSIGYEACMGLTSLESVVIPETVKSIGEAAFYDCTSLFEVTVLSRDATIGDVAFGYYYAGRKEHVVDGFTIYGYKGSTIETYAATDDRISFVELTYVCDHFGGEATCKDLAVCDNCGSSYGVLNIENHKNTEIRNASLPSEGELGYTGDVWCIDCNSLVSNGQYYSVLFTYTVANDTVTITGYSGEISGDVVIPGIIDGYSVTAISDSAFKNCSEITSVVVPDNVASIGKYAFEGCASLKRITFGSGIKKISAYAFKDCSSLTEINTTDLSAFAQIEYAANTGYPLYVTKEGKLFVDGEEVKNELIIPEGTKNIAKYTFQYLDNDITSVVVPDSVENIGERAFYYTTSLVELSLGKQIKSIGSTAFNGCSLLKKINIADLKAWCEVELYNEASHPFYASKAGKLYFNGVEIVGELLIPDGTSKISGICLQYLENNITSVVIPDTVESIGQNSFYNCVSLTSVTIGSGVKSIGAKAFSGCSSLNKLYITDLAAWCSIDFDGGWSHPFYASTSGTLYLNGVALNSAVVLPDGVTRISDYSLQYMRGITSVTIPTSVVSIGQRAFHNCSSITDVYYTGAESQWNGIDITTSGNDYLLNADIHFNSEEIFTYAIVDGKAIIVDNIGNLGGEVIIPAEIDGYPVVKLGVEAFKNSNKITSIVLPDSLESIDVGAFENCASLTRVSFGSGIKNIAVRTFVGCENLSELDIRSLKAWSEINFENIMAHPFYVTKSGKLLLNGVELSGELIIPEGVSVLSKYSYQYFNNLTSVVIPDSVDLIGERAFYYSTNLEKITLGRGVSSIGVKAYSGCSKLNVLNLKSLENWCSMIFEDDASHPFYASENGKLYLDGTEVYGLLIIPEGTEKINDDCFSCFDNEITSVIIPDSVQSIGAGAFSGIASLNEVTIGTGVKFIGAKAFANCTKLTKVNISNLNYWCGIVFDGGWSHPFYASKSGTLYIDGWAQTDNLRIPDGVSVINSFCFEFLSNVKSVSIPASVTSINDRAFFMCNALTDVYYRGSAEEWENIAVSSNGNDTLINANLHFNIDVVIGDVNDDWVLSADDAIYLLYNTLYGTSEYPISQNCDFNNDGMVTGEDAVYLLYHIVFGDLYPLFGETFVVTFKDWDETVLKTETVESGKSATAPATPSRDGYTFSGWDKVFDSVTGDLVVTATYTKNPVVQFTVTFKDWDGTVLKTETVESGKSATAPAAPSRDGYTFSGWDKAYDSVTGDLVVTATYTKNPVVQFTVTFKDWDGTVLKTETVESGKSATAPATPTRDGYTFSGWDKAYDNVTADIVVIAQYQLVTAPTIIVSNVTGKAGQSVVVPVIISNNPGVAGAKITMYYDPSLKLIAASSGDAFSHLQYTNPGKFVSPCNFTWDSESGMATKNGTILLLTFDIPSEAVSDDVYTIKCTSKVGHIYDEDLNDIIFEIISGSITVI